MKVKQLKELLENQDENLEVFFEQTNDEFQYSYLERVKVVEVNFNLETNSDIETAVENCLVLTDEI